MSVVRFGIRTLVVPTLSMLASFLLVSLTPLPYLVSSSPQNEWATVSHLLYNSYHLWRIDPLAKHLADLFALSLERSAPLYAALLCLGSGVMIRTLYRSKRLPGLLLWPVCSASAAVPSLCVGQDTVLYGAIAWVPLLTASFCALLRCIATGATGALPPVLITTLFFGFLLSHSANQLSLIGVALSLLLLSIRERDGLSKTQAYPLIATVCVLLIAVPTLLAVSHIPAPFFPVYPADARVVPDDGLPNNVRPNLGREYPIAILDRGTLRDTLTPLVLLLFGASAFALGIRHDAHVVYAREEDDESLSPSSASHTPCSEGIRAVLFLALSLGAIALWDLILPEGIAAIGPIATVSRLTPDGLGIALVTSILGVGWWLLTLGTLSLYSPGQRLASFRNPVILSFAVLGIPVLVHSLAHVGPLTALTTSSTWQLRSLYLQNPTSTSFVVSPSLGVLKHFLYLFGEAPISRLTLAEKIRDSYSTLGGIPVTAISEPETSRALLDLMFDNDPRTRWSLSAGRQLGGERFKLSFTSPLTMRGLVLSTGSFPTDYPRGVQISIPQECSASGSPYGIWSFPSWQGSIALSKDGYPFFTSQSDVRVYFGVAISTRCVEITQIGHDSHFDWSVAEVGFIR